LGVILNFLHSLVKNPSPTKKPALISQVRAVKSKGNLEELEKLTVVSSLAV
jgi:hypothetical protein